MDSRLPNIAVEAGFLGEKLARRCLRRLLSIRNLWIVRVLIKSV